MEVTEWLLLNGAQVDAVDKSGDTALHHAARNGRPGIAQILCEAGCSVALKNAYGQSAFSIAGPDEPRRRRRPAHFILRSQ